jgi:uncharacterized membrane protein YeiH
MDWHIPLSPALGQQLRDLLELVATLAFALSGVIAAARKRLDVVGVCVVAFVTAFGGGTLRDLLLDHRPFFWVGHTGYLWSGLVLCVGAVTFMRQRHLQPTERALLWPDAIGLGLFTGVGVDRALTLGEPALVAVILGVVTSCFGGVLRDVLCNDVPSALNDHRPYALWAFLGGWLYVLLLVFGFAPWLALSVTVVFTAGMRVVSVRLGWRLPGWGR